MKTTMAQALIEEFSVPGDLVVDPFCGAGVVPLEAALRGRSVYCRDINPYAFVLTKAKLEAPKSREDALTRFDLAWESSRQLLEGQDLRRVPGWVRRFFHSETLRSALALRDACVSLQDYFLLACLLGILHHQRPGFLSFPASNLVPYLRDEKYPRDVYPELYHERDVHTRMIKKLERTFARVPEVHGWDATVELADASKVAYPIANVSAVVTSPPYMNELDYVRDNRLRLWFISRSLPAVDDFSKHARARWFFQLISRTFALLASTLAPGAHVALVVGEAHRGGKGPTPVEVVLSAFADTSDLRDFEIRDTYVDRVPDIRLSRGELRRGREETILVFRKRMESVG